MKNIFVPAKNIAREFPQTCAFGISGSMASGKTDKYSDYDFCVFTKGLIPNANQKRKIYHEMGIIEIDNMEKSENEFDYFNLDFEISNEDGFQIDGSERGFLWMDYGKIILHTKGNPDPGQCLQNIKNLFKDIAELFKSIYKNEKTKKKLDVKIQKDYYFFGVYQ